MTSHWHLAILSATMLAFGGMRADVAAADVEVDRGTDTIQAANIAAAQDEAEQVQTADDHGRPETHDAPAAEPIEFFQARDEGHVDVQFIARNDRDARVIITNNTDQPVTLQLPEAFAGVPALAQFGGGAGGGGRGGGFGGGARTGGAGGGAQAVGGGMGGGMMGGGGMGGGGMGMFSVPPEETRRINVPVVCLDHGLRNPSSSMPYEIVPATATERVTQPAVVELLKAFGRGELDHGAAQAAAWNLNSGMSWNELAAKRQGTRLRPSRLPYFMPQQLQAALAYATQATRLAAMNAEEYRDFGPQEPEEDLYDSDELSATD